MVVLGLTGSIGMGKTTAGRVFRRMGIPVHDADTEVHRLLGVGGSAVADVGEAFPGVVRDGAVDRAELGRRVFGDAAALRRLEGILHPMVAKAERRFLARAAAARRSIVVLDIPLLFETGAERRCDATIVMTAPGFIQTARVFRRSGMTRARLAGIVARQIPDTVKRRRADFVVSTGLDRRNTLRALMRIVRLMRQGRERRDCACQGQLSWKLDS